MNKLLLRLTSLAMLAVALVACTKEQNSKLPEPIFPEAVTKMVEPEEEAVIKFTANLDWKLSIPAETDIFRILDGSQEVFSVRGKAGEVAVTVKCIAKEKDFANHSADLTLEMGGKKHVIASVNLPSATRTMNITVADVKDGAFVPSTDPTFDWTYTGQPVAVGENINMLWDMASMSYKVYVRVESNYEWKFGQLPDGVDIAGGKVSGLFKEYAFTVETPNLQTDKTIPFVLVATDNANVTSAFNFVVPQHTPSFELRKVIVKNGYFELPLSPDGYLSYEYEKDALVEKSNIELVWPEDRVGFCHYLLVDANFNYSIEAPSWLKVSKGTLNGTKTECEIEALETSLDELKGNIVFKIKGTNYSKTFSVTVPACKNIVKDDVPSLVEFNEEGKMKDMNGEFSILDKAFAVTSAGNLQYFKFVKDGDWYKSESLSQAQGGAGCDWLKISNTWSDNGQILQNYEFHITADANTGVAREAMVIAVPSHVMVNDPDGQLLNVDGNDVNPEYANYLVVKAQQLANPTASGDPIVAVDPEYWPMSMSSFKAVTMADGWEYWEVADYFTAENYYRLVYGTDVSNYPTVGEYTFLKFNRMYTDYKVYALSDRMNPVVDKENFWLTVNPSQYASNEVSIQMTPDKCTDNPKDAFIVFSDDNGDFAALYCSYDPYYNFGGGNSSVAPAFAYPEYAAMDGSKLEEITPDSPLFNEWNPGDGTPLWHLTYTSEAPTMSMLTGLPQGMASANAEWISVEPMGDQTTIYMDKSMVPAEAWKDGKVTSSIVFYDSSWATALTLVCTLDLSATSAQ